MTGQNIQVGMSNDVFYKSLFYGSQRELSNMSNHHIDSGLMMLGRTG